MNQTKVQAVTGEPPEKRVIGTHADPGPDHDVDLMLIEYKCLRDEIQARLVRISKLVMVLLTGLLVYATTIFVPLRFSGTSATSIASVPGSGGAMHFEPIVLIYLALIGILPFVSFAIEIMCTSESDAITRTGIYIRDNIERKIRKTGYRGWEDWLDRQDKALRRRTSETFATLSRYFIIMLYCLASATIVGLLISVAFSLHFAVAAIGLFVIYFGCALGIYVYLREARKSELSPNFYDVVVVDVDGCLVNDSGIISERNVKAIDAVKRLGVTVILATGRSSYGTWRIMGQLSAHGMHAVAHGACIASWPDKRNDVLFPLDAEAIGLIVRELNASRILWAAFGQAAVFCEEGRECELGKVLRERGDIDGDEVKITPIKDLSNWSWRRCESIAKIWCYLDVSDAIKSNQILAIAIINTHSTRTTNSTVEFFSTNANKVSAVERILGEYRKSGAKVLALGDHDNDEDVMKWAAHALAPSNASIAIRKLDNVDVFPMSNNDDFIAEALRAYYELKI